VIFGVAFWQLSYNERRAYGDFAIFKGWADSAPKCNTNQTGQNKSTASAEKNSPHLAFFPCF
jgi:hypothetical protein